MYIKRRQLSKAKLMIIAFVSLFAGIYVFSGDGIENLQTSANVFEVEQIIIDAGHGGIDPGAIGINKEIEKDINLSIALKLNELLTLSGYDTVMTRTQDVSIHDSKYTTVTKQKTSDIKNRLKIANNNPKSITVSIHQNKFQQSKFTGAQMFYGKNNPLSKNLAESLQNSFVKNLQKGNTRETKQATKSVYLINNAKTPTVLAECGFLSNSEEAQRLNTESYQSQVAFTLYCGIVDFLNALDDRVRIEEK